MVELTDVQTTLRKDGPRRVYALRLHTAGAALANLPCKMIMARVMLHRQSASRRTPALPAP